MFDQGLLHAPAPVYVGGPRGSPKPTWRWCWYSRAKSWADLVVWAYMPPMGLYRTALVPVLSHAHGRGWGRLYCPCKQEVISDPLKDRVSGKALGRPRSPAHSVDYSAARFGGGRAATTAEETDKQAPRHGNIRQAARRRDATPSACALRTRVRQRRQRLQPPAIAPCAVRDALRSRPSVHVLGTRVGRCQ